MTGISRDQLASWMEKLGRLVLALIFIYAAFLKIASPQEFAHSIAAYQSVPLFLINPLALGLPLFELACGLLLLIGFLSRIALLGMLMMLIVFMIATVLTMLRGLVIDCGCFGAHSWVNSNPWSTFLRDGCLLLLTAFLYVRHSISPDKLKNRHQQSPNP